MPKLNTTVLRTIQKLDQALAIISPKKGTPPNVQFAQQLRSMLERGRPFELAYGDEKHIVDPTKIRIHKTTISLMLAAGEFTIPLLQVVSDSRPDPEDGNKDVSFLCLSDDNIPMSFGPIIQSIVAMPSLQPARKAA